MPYLPYTWLTVYPRVCGGTCTVAIHIMAVSGLSPRMRGNPGPTGPIYSISRSIPAYAGEPWCCFPLE